MAKKSNPQIEVVANGTNRLTLVFPEDAKIGKIRTRVPMGRVVEMLKGVAHGEVEGQECLELQLCDVYNYLKTHCK
jgi:hypothetical protein